MTTKFKNLLSIAIYTIVGGLFGWLLMSTFEGISIFPRLLLSSFAIGATAMVVQVLLKFANITSDVKYERAVYATISGLALITFLTLIN